MRLVRNNTFKNPILLVDGHGGSGKSKISRILECFNDIEKSKEDESFHMILHLHRIGKIDDDVTQVLLTTIIDRLTYNQLISREINFKFSDATSVFKYPYPLNYIKRMFINDKDIVCKKITNDYPILQNMTTNAIISNEILFKSFGDRLRIIYVKTNPITTIYNMFNSGFGRSIGMNPTNIMLTYENGNPVDIDGYSKLGEMDRVVKWVYLQSILVKKSYKSLEPKVKEKVMVIDFEAFTIFPQAICSQISGFINRKPTWKLRKTIKSVYPELSKDIIKKREFIESLATEESIKLIDEL